MTVKEGLHMNTTIPTFTLHDGRNIPVIGAGTDQLKGNEGSQAIQSAIDMGYRLIDTAFNYDNEGTVGNAVKNSSVARSELTITSKLPGRYHGYDRAVKAIQESLFRADLDYYDVYLIHWPNPKQDIYLEAWQALIDAQKWGLIRSIGVCNFLPEHIERLGAETGVWPSINQIELHPFFNQSEQRKWHEKHSIQTQAWSPLSRGKHLLQNETLQNIADKHKKTIPQVVLRWHYQLGVISIPRSASSDHQFDNKDIFDFVLDKEDMEGIALLDRPDGQIKKLDPKSHEEF